MGIDYPDFASFLASMFTAFLGFFFATCFIAGLIKGEEGGIKPLKINDKFDIGYINESPCQKNIFDGTNVAVKIKQAKVKKAKKNTDNELITDCINALVSLGEKRSSAKSIVSKYFANNPKTTTVDQFITGVFTK